MVACFKYELAAFAIPDFAGAAYLYAPLARRTAYDQEHPRGSRRLSQHKSSIIVLARRAAGLHGERPTGEPGAELPNRSANALDKGQPLLLIYLSL